ncbi:hypothetical protein FRC17_004299, partial [Serendipita sp. 399]
MSLPEATNADNSLTPQENASPAILSTPTASSISKRKYDEALTLLDDATGTRPQSTLSLDRPPPPKRARTSVYRTLAKYGIGTSVDPKTTSLSNLQKVIMRAKAGISLHAGQTNDVDTKMSTYDPSSRDAFLTRLQTFRLLTYSSRPPEIDAVAAALCGWFNEADSNLRIKSNHQANILVSAISAAQVELVRKASKDSISLNLNFVPDENPAIVALFGWDLVPKTASAKSTTTSGISTPVSSSRLDKAMVNCQLCNRQVGLWSFQSPNPSRVVSPGGTPGSPHLQTTRSFDVLKEHRPHCPYVVKTTYLPVVNLSSKTASASTNPDLFQPLPFVEGWKARMSIISRSQWRRANTSGILSSQAGVASSVPSTPITDSDSPFYLGDASTEVDEVKEIVKDVKSRHGGGRDLLKFVKAALAQNVSTPLVNFQVNQPLAVPKNVPKCEVELVHHVFANSYYQPAITAYTPPKCGPLGSGWSAITLNWTVTSNGTQYDRLAGVTLSNVE